MLHIENIIESKCSFQFSSLIDVEVFHFGFESDLIIDLGNPNCFNPIPNPTANFMNREYQRSFTSKGGIFVDESLDSHLTISALILSNPKPSSQVRYINHDIGFECGCTLIVTPCNIDGRKNVIINNSSLRVYAVKTLASLKKLRYSHLANYDVVIVSDKFLDSPSYWGLVSYGVSSEPEGEVIFQHVHWLDFQILVVLRILQ